MLAQGFAANKALKSVKLMASNGANFAWFVLEDDRPQG